MDANEMDRICHAFFFPKPISEVHRISVEGERREPMNKETGNAQSVRSHYRCIDRYLIPTSTCEGSLSALLYHQSLIPQCSSP